MKRRNFLIGAGGAAIGGSALLGSGAFSRVESHRSVAVQVANDANAYLGIKSLETENSDNYFDYDTEGHATIDIADQAALDGQGINSNSITWFDGLFKLCNQGKDDITLVELDATGLTVNDENNALDVYFYTGTQSSLPPSKANPPNHWNREFEVVDGGETQVATLEEESGENNSEKTNVASPADDGDPSSDDYPRTQILAPGSCTRVGMRFNTKPDDTDDPVNASEGADNDNNDDGVRTLLSGELSITAVAPEAGQST